MKKIEIFLFLSCGGWVSGQGSLGEIIGTIYDESEKSGLFNAKVWVNDNDRIYTATTDIDGRFRISAVPAGEYAVLVKFENDTMTDIVVIVPADGFGDIGKVSFHIVHEQEVFVVDGVHQSLKLQITAIPVCTLTSKDIIHQANKFDIKSMVASMTSDVKISDDGELMFRGSRKGEMLYLVDGVKTSAIGSIPSCAIGSITVYTGGMPAKYGDTLGGVVILETKSYFDLLKERKNRL
jgi:hypothetical protein